MVIPACARGGAKVIRPYGSLAVLVESSSSQSLDFDEGLPQLSEVKEVLV